MRSGRRRRRPLPEKQQSASKLMLMFFSHISCFLTPSLSFPFLPSYTGRLRPPPHRPLPRPRPSLPPSPLHPSQPGRDGASTLVGRGRKTDDNESDAQGLWADGARGHAAAAVAEGRGGRCAQGREEGRGGAREDNLAANGTYLLIPPIPTIFVNRTRLSGSTPPCCSLSWEKTRGGEIGD